MSDVSIYQSNYVGFRLKSEFSPSINVENPVGWREDELQIIRDKKHHGILTQITNELSFTGEAKEYIERAYKLGGINTRLSLTKTKLVKREDSDDVAFELDYFGLADFESRKIKNGYLSIKFTSNDLERVLATHNNDEFELERLDTIDSKPLEPYQLYKTHIPGRSLSIAGESNVAIEDTEAEFWGENYQSFVISDTDYTTVRTRLISRGNPRHSSVDINQELGGGTDPASQMFFVDSTDQNELLISFRVDYNIKMWVFPDPTINPTFFSSQGTVECYIVKYKDNGVSYDVLSEIKVGEIFVNTIQLFELNGAYVTELEFDEGVMIAFKTVPSGGGIHSPLWAYCTNHKLVLSGSDRYEESPSLSVTFVHDAINRLIEIITGKNDIFYSEYFGRTELGYQKDGFAGLVGLISGYWLRAFDPASENYKSITIAYSKLLESVNAVFNTGMGIEKRNFKEIVVVEDLKYFYQDQVVVRLGELNNIERSTDKSLFFSSVEVGYNKGGDYEEEFGLDEPNTKRNYITPVRVIKNEFSRISDIRADEYGMEITRRKPQALYGEEDTQRDDHIWFLDLKRQEDGPNFTQNNWEDRLDQEPSGVLEPQTFRAFLFTPLRMLLRHSWIIRSGLEPYITKLLKFSANSDDPISELTTHFTGEDNPLTENQDIEVSVLDKSRVLPEIVKGEHKVTDEIMSKIKGTTSVNYNGVVREIPNFYFKFEWINEDGETERGYLLSLKPKNTGVFEFQKANEEIRLI